MIQGSSASITWVVCLCADWCGTCQSYRADFETLKAKWPIHQMVWVDIEDKADWLGDLEVEDFPTLLIFRASPVAQTPATIQFFGTMLPHIEHLERLLQSLKADSSSAARNSATATTTADANASANDVVMLCQHIVTHFSTYSA